MKIYLPNDWVAPDDVSGQLPEIPVTGTTNYWLQIVNYWSSLGYFMLPSTNNRVVLEFLNIGPLKEKNGYMQVAWWDALCDTNLASFGEVEDWQAVWQVHPDVYNQGLVPLIIPNSTYVDDQEVTQQRLWKQWGSQHHDHYYLPPGTNEIGLTNDRYFIPTWSWGADILGTEMFAGQDESGVNIVPRDVWQKELNAEGFDIIPVTPTP